MKRLIVILLIISGCDLLTTRDPEKPEVSRNSFIVPTTPDILFQNLKNSFEEKVLENYMACFVDASYTDKQFKFVPAASSIALYSNLANWDLIAERGYFNNLRTVPGDNQPIILLLTNERPVPLGDSAVYQFDYRIQIPIADQSDLSEYSGSALFRIYRDNRQQWAIGEWEDIKNENAPGWSELKGRYY